MKKVHIQDFNTRTPISSFG